MDGNTTLSDLFPSKYLKADDLGGQDRLATITAVEMEEIGPKKDQKVCLSFAGTEKRLVLNKTNAEVIGKLHGQRVVDWVGKSIVLYPTEVEYQGRTQLGIRVRTRVPVAAAQAPVQAPPPEPAIPEESWDAQSF